MALCEMAIFNPFNLPATGFPSFTLLWTLCERVAHQILFLCIKKIVHVVSKVEIYSSRHLLLLSWQRSSWKTGVAVTTLRNTSSCHLTAPLRQMVKHTNISSFTERCYQLVQPRYDFRAKGVNVKLHLALESSIFYLVLKGTKYYIYMPFLDIFWGERLM